MNCGTGIIEERFSLYSGYPGLGVTWSFLLLFSQCWKLDTIGIHIQLDGNLMYFGVHLLYKRGTENERDHTSSRGTWDNE
jgi:hypothetical protein